MARTTWTRSRPARLLLITAVLSSAASWAGAVAFVPRFHHSATLLADRNILLCGGAISGSAAVNVNTPGEITSGCQLFLEGQATYANTGSMAVVRASHTATLLPDGRVLIAGGHDGAAFLGTAEVYDPVTGSFAALGQINMGAGPVLRSNHTATLLENGKVLICGGQTAAAAFTATCVLFDPAVNTFSAAGSMQAARAVHTATLLRDGRVFLAGGYDSTKVPPYLVTTEAYNPATSVFDAAHSLIAARAFHTATLMGSGKIFIAGGFNSRDTLANKGILDSTEIYDPVADSMVPAAKMKVRRMGHTATLNPSGEVDIIGGLGNLATTYLTNFISDPIDAGVFVTGTFGASNILSTMNVTAINAQLTIDSALVQDVIGIPQNADVYFSCPTIILPEAQIYFTPGNQGNNAQGLRANFAGTFVSCKDVAGVSVCGVFRRPYTLLNINGTASIPKITGLTISNFNATGGVLRFPSTLDVGNPTVALNPGSNITGAAVRITGFSSRFDGATISSGVFSITAGDLVQNSSYSVALTGGRFSIPKAGDPPVTIASDGNGGYQTSLFNIDLRNLTGIASWLGNVINVPAQTFPDGTVIPDPAASAPVSGIGGSLQMVPTRINLDGGFFRSDVATIVVRSMMFSGVETYVPYDPPVGVLSNTWKYGSRMVGAQTYNNTAIRSLSGDLRVHGGQSCSLAPDQFDIDCTRIEASTSSAIIPTMSASTLLASALVTGPRGNHAATTLPDGTILITGGTNGPNILGTAEIFDPTNELFTPTGGMHAVRDLHSATLLPNGRVLVAGGFSTSAISSGATKTAELYYPDTRVWLQTEPMITSHSLHTAVLLPDGNVMVIGGLANGVYENRVEIYYSTAATWHQTTSMGTRRAQHSATLLKNGKVLVVGGLNSSGILGTAELYNPATGLWAATIGPLSGGEHSHSHTASLMFDGRVIIAGGNNEYGDMNQSQIYDPVASTFVKTETLKVGGKPMNVSRVNHAANILPNGLIVVSGGAQSDGKMVKQLETYNIAYATWTLGGDFGSARAYHTMTLAKNGFLYFIGGYNGINYLSSIEKAYFTAFPDLQTTAAPPSTRASTITVTDRTIFDRNELLNVTGNNFHGATEASGGGSGGRNSSHVAPTMLLEAVGGSGGTGSQSNSGFVLDLAQRMFVSTASWSLSNTSMTVLLPAGAAGSLSAANLPYGWYHLRMGANAQYSDSKLVQAGPPKPVLPITALTPVTLSTSDVRWSWGLPGGPAFDGFNVYSATDGVFITSLTAATVNFIQRNLTPNCSAQVMIAPYRLTGDGPLLQSATTFPFANIPASFSISSVTADQIRLGWSPNLNRDGTVYEISQSTDNFTTGVTITTPVPTGLNLQSTFYIRTPLADNTTYYFRIRAFDGNGVPSGFSAVTSTRTRSSVSGVVGTPLTTYSIRWSWLDPGGVASYKVFNSTTGVLLGMALTNQYVDSNLGTNTIRSVTVRALSGAGEGPMSESATTYTLAADPIPATPDVVSVTTGSFKVNWLTNENPPGTLYTAQISSDPTFGLISAEKQTTGDIAGFGDLVPPSNVFAIRVFATNSNSPGVANTPVVFGSTPTLANKPDPVTFTGTTPTSISLSWGSNGNGSSTTYQVTFSTDDFVTTVTTAVPFSLGFNGTVTTIGGLLTSTTYSVRVVGRNSVGRETAIGAPLTSTMTSSGGAVLGALAGVLSASANSIILGSIGSVPPRLITLRAPFGTFSSDVTLTISSKDVTGVGNCANGSPGLGLSITANPPLQPNKIVYLTISYTVAEQGALPTEQLVLMRQEPSLGKCVPLQTSVDTTEHTITAALNHFSVFQLAAVAPTATAEKARIFPNPWYASRVGQVTFHQMPAGARIRIFTLKGELVSEHHATASGMFTWGGINRGGRRIASGVYLVVIEGTGPKKILKLVVLQ